MTLSASATSAPRCALHVHMHFTPLGAALSVSRGGRSWRALLTLVWHSHLAARAQVGPGFNRDYWARFEKFVKDAAKVRRSLMM